MSKKVWATGLALALAVVTAAGAAQLRYRLVVGEALRYQSTIAAEGSMTVEGPLGGQALPFTISAEETRSLKVVENVGEGRFWVESRCLKAKGGAKGVDGATDANMPAVDYRMKMDHLGNVFEMEQMKAKDNNKGPEVDLNLGSLTALGQLTGFPAEDVAPGGTWDKEIPLKGKDGKVVKAKVHCKLISLNGDEAKIAVTYETPIPVTEGRMRLAGMELPIRVEGKADGKSTTLWHMARGCLLRTEGTTNIEMKLDIGGLGGALPASARFLVASKTHLAEE